MADLHLTGKQEIAARDAARSGRYQLFLGAGASVGAVNRQGALPLARELVKILALRYPKAPIDESLSLQRAYQRAVRASSPEDVWRTLNSIFSGARHEQWFTDMTALPWRRVWTLNVDDAFENSYERTLASNRRSLRVIDWHDNYSETGDLQLIHLHGHVSGHEPRPLIFSYAEYQGAARASTVWHQVLGGILGTEPLVLVGARLLDDPDVEALLMQTPPTASAPSIVVDPYIDEGNAWELRQLGYLIIQSPGDEFFEHWVQRMELSREALRALEEARALSVPQFSRLESNRAASEPRGHDFYGGDAPVWADITHNRAALFGWIRNILEDLEQWSSDADREAHLHIQYSTRLMGLSTGLMKVARDAVPLGLACFMFDRSSRWNVSTLVDVCKQGPTLLLFDGGADFADDIDRTLKAAKREGASVFAVVGEADNNDLRLEGRLSADYTKSVRHVSRRGLDRSDSSNLVRMLASSGRLGVLEQESGRARLDHFIGRDIFSGMMDLEHAAGFRKRLAAELGRVGTGWQLDMVLLLAMAAQVGRPVTLAEAAIATGKAPADVSTELRRRDDFAAVISLADNLVAARQRDRALDAIFELVPADQALSRLNMMVQRLAPLTSRAGLQSRNRVPMLVGHLMSSKNLTRTFKGQDLNRFYEDLLPRFGDWNGRYWEQRALYMKFQKDWARAESFAGRAVTLYDDAYTRTTLGTILINKASHFAAQREPVWREFYARGKGELSRARERESGGRVSIFAFLGATMELLRHLPATEEFSYVIADDWRADYATLRISLRGEDSLQSTRRADDLLAQWERHGFDSPPPTT